MQELSFDEVDQVAGGVRLAVVIAVLDAVADFCQGVYDGYNAK